MQTREILVIGGGISGATFAWACAREGMSVEVLEAGATAGGCIHSQHLENGYWYELGAHTCYNSYGALLGILEQTLGLEKLLPRVKAPFRLLIDGQVRPITKALSIGELLLCAPRIFTAKKEGRTVREYYGRLVGSGNYERLFSPLFAAVPSQKADDFPADMLFKKRTRRKDAPRSWTLPGGLSSMIDSMLRTPNLTFTPKAEVASIERVDSGFEVALTNGTRLTARHLALATPPVIGSRLLQHVSPELAGALGKIHSSHAETVGVVVPADSVSLERFAGLIPLDGRFFSAVTRDVVPDPSWRGFAFHFPHGGELEQRLAAIATILGVERSQLETVHVRRVVLPSPTLGHRQITAEIEQALPKSPGLFLTGNYFAGLSLEDCVQRSLSEAKRLLDQRSIQGK